MQWIEIQEVDELWYSREVWINLFIVLYRAGRGRLNKLSFKKPKGGASMQTGLVMSTESGRDVSPNTLQPHS